MRDGTWARRLLAGVIGSLLMIGMVSHAALAQEEAVEVVNGTVDGLSAQAYDANAKVTYVPASPITFVVGSGEKDYDDNGAACYLYQYVPNKGDKLKVTSNGVAHTFTYSTKTYSWVDEHGSGADIDVQLYARLSPAENTAGEHTLTVWYQNYDAEGRGAVSFSLVQSPVASIAYEPAHTIVLVRGADSANTYEYDPVTKKGHTYHHYYFPHDTRLVGDVLSVRYADGTSKRYVYAKFKDPAAGYERLGFVNERDKTDFIEEYDIDISAEQPYAKRWQPGKHAFIVRYAGKTASVPVTVQKQAVTKVTYVRKKAYRTSTAKAIAYTKGLSIYDKRYAKRVHRYQLHFAPIKPASGDVLKVKQGGEVVKYKFNAGKHEFVCKSGSGAAIPERDVVIRELVANASTTEAAFSCTYRGVDFSIPFSVSRKKQTLKASKKQVVLGTREQLGATSSGFVETPLVCTSSNPAVATVDSHGIIVARHVGTTRVTIRAKANVAYKASKAKVVIVRVGRVNPMKVSAKKNVRLKVGKATEVLAVRKAKGEVRYANASKGEAAKRFKVNTKTGRVTARKGTKRGTYTIKVKVRAKGTKTYLPRTRTKKITVTV